MPQIQASRRPAAYFALRGQNRCFSSLPYMDQHWRSWQKLPPPCCKHMLPPLGLAPHIFTHRHTPPIGQSPVPMYGKNSPPRAYVAAGACSIQSNNNWLISKSRLAVHCTRVIILYLNKGICNLI